MTMNTSGPISLANSTAGQSIELEFYGVSGVGCGISQYYRGGGVVPNAPVNNNIPTSGPIRFSNFYGSTKHPFIVVACSAGYIAYSYDGMNFTAVSAANDPSNVWCAIVCYNNRFVMVGRNTVSGASCAAYSDDGINFTMGSIPGEALYNGITCNNGFYVAVGSDLAGNSYNAYSSDGVNFNSTTMSTGSIPIVYSAITSYNGHYVSCGRNPTNGQNTAAFYSDNGTSFAQCTVPYLANWNGVAYSNGVYIIVGNTNMGQGVIIRSTDGVSFSQGQSFASSYYGVSAHNDYFISVGGVGAAVVSYSTNGGITWNNGSIPAMYKANGVVFANGLWIVVGQPNGSVNGIAYSSNGVNFVSGSVSGTAPNNLTWNAICSNQ